MRIRSITYFIDPNYQPFETQLSALQKHKQTLRKNLEKAGFEVQSIRLATTPFPSWTNPEDRTGTLDAITTFVEETHDAGFNYLSVGPCKAADLSDSTLLPAILSISDLLFLSMQVADPQRGISIKDIKVCAQTIQQVAYLESNGFANLRFAALANVKPCTPFFPAAYAAPGKAAFSLAMECADTVQEIFGQSNDIESGCRRLINTFETQATSMEKIIQNVDLGENDSFQGFDFSLAPFPETWCSFGKALETLGVSAIGSAGSLAAAAILASALDTGKWKKAGFNGLMMPILEDNILAQRSADGILSIYDVLHYSSVCGTGLDTVPLPGDIAVEKIEALLLDVAALALRLDKPLTARLMPIPGKHAGDPVKFDFSFFAKGKVLDFPYHGVHSPLTADQNILLRSRK
ncbi:MAG: hypothetical protein XD73_1378 [Anaerolinea thermophila]|uniref:DUF711 family protein n=1 Tax=Anaerolinea thermophila TaxID=167964 RepID=A0A117LGD5_9CHLR|nr:MAG: hypothetical protein XD73_1378 [Anaerolinea thermophila]